MMKSVRVESNDKGDRIGIILFVCILLSFIPILITSLFLPGLKSSSLYAASIGLAFFIQTVILFFYYGISKESQINKGLIVLGGLFLTAQIITVSISMMGLLRVDTFDYINVLVRFVGFIFFVSIPYYFKMTKTGLLKFMKCIVLMGFIACVYNMVYNYAGLRNILSINNPYAVNFKSFFLGRNSFAQFLFFATVANTFLFFSKRSLFHWLCYFLFLFNIFATLSRTVMASISLFIFFFFILYYRKKVISRIVILASAGMIVLSIVSNTTLTTFIKDILIRSDTGTTGRSVIWEIAIQMLNHNNWAFGIGYMTSSSLLKDMGYTSQFHSFFIETLVGGGLIDLLLHLSIIFLVIRKVIHIYKYDQTTGIIFISAYIALVFYSLFESVSYFSIGYVDSMFRTFFITLPLLYSNAFPSAKSMEKSRLISEELMINKRAV
ncbi:MAG: O-antigen ligase family protein [Clostridiaceae bacterium]